MPIIGLSDRGLAFPEIGQIRKGAKKTVNAPGKDLPYFRVEFDAKEVDTIAAFTKQYGPTPTDINIVLPFNEIDRLWDAWLEAYTAGRLVARADGEKFQYLVDTKTGEQVVKNGIDLKTGVARPYTAGMIVGYDYQNKPVKCKETARLKIVIPELQRLAYMTVLTGSKNDIKNISSQLVAIQTFCAGMGKGLGGTPLVLRRRPHEVSTPDPKDKTKRVRRTKYLLSIEADPEFVKRALIETKRLALPGNGLSLPSPQGEPSTGPEWEDIEETDDDTEMIDAEVTDLPMDAALAMSEELPQPEVEQQPEGKKEMTLEEAGAVEVEKIDPKTKEKTAVRLDLLTKAQLEFIATNNKEAIKVEAALLILEKKFNMPRPGAA